MYSYEEIDAVNSFEHEKLMAYIKKNGHLRKYKAGELLYYFGDGADGLYYIASGKVRGFYLDEDGSDRTCIIVPSGMFVGEDAFTSSLTRVVGVDVVADAELYYLDRTSLLDYCKDKPDVIHELLGVFVKKMVTFLQALNSAQQNTSRKKLAYFVLQMSRATSEKNDFSHEHIADVTGISRVKVSKTLREFEQEKLIKVSYKKIEILDFEGLLDILNN